MNRVLLRVLSLPVTLFVSALPAQARADVLECRSSLHGVLVYAQGWVNVLPVTDGQSGTWSFICNLDGNWKGVSATTCAKWTELLMQLKRDDRQADFYYYSVPPGTTCSTLPSYGNSIPPTFIGAVANPPSATPVAKAGLDIPPPLVDAALFPARGDNGARASNPRRAGPAGH